MDNRNEAASPEVNDTIVRIRQLSADEQLRRQAAMREKRLHDEQSALYGAKQEGRQQERNELREKMRKMGYTEEQIKDLLSD